MYGIYALCSDAPTVAWCVYNICSLYCTVYNAEGIH